ncbi:MAG: serine hydrolase, partial [Chloroflexota bacterium]
GMMERIGKLPLRFQPGDKWNYSVATDVVGYLVQVISDMPLGDFLQEKIIRPLGMDDTDYEIPDEKLGRLTSMYGQMKPKDPYMKLLDAPETSFHRPPVMNQRGGSGLLSTTSDYVKFAQMLANGGMSEGRRYIGRKTLDLMRQNHLPEHMIPLSISNPFPGYGFGLGFTQVVDEAQVGILSSLGNYGWSGAADTNYWVDPVEDLIGMTFMQYIPSQTIPVQQDFPNLLYQALV